jgi:UDP-2,3-diacylglucosamine pyrophosphatase LpxH
LILRVTAFIGHVQEIAEIEALAQGHFHSPEYYIAITAKENSIYFSK